MEQEGKVMIGVIVVAVILLIVALKKRSELVLNFVLRGILGTLCIYYGNQFMIFENISCHLAINPVTVLTSASLGFPGVILLFGINLYTLL